jgi:hypothetical protein
MGSIVTPGGSALSTVVQLPVHPPHYGVLMGERQQQQQLYTLQLQPSPFEWLS